MHTHKEEILEWANKENIQLNTQRFNNEVDKLIAYSYYYYLKFPEKEEESLELNKKFGIEIIDQTFGTGVYVILINVNKLVTENKNKIIPYLNLEPVSKNHIIVHIGYTFGSQSHDIIKPVLMLFGPKIRSVNILGRCGGLIGNQGDMLVATRHFLDKTHDCVSVNYGKINIDELKEKTKCNVHVGPFLTVAGTILQNSDLLRYYKYVMGCVG